jgi:hypothetical protein
MGARAQYEIPAGLKEARERFEQWRSSQTPELCTPPNSVTAG